MHKYAVIIGAIMVFYVYCIFYCTFKALNQVLVNYLTCFAVIQLCSTLLYSTGSTYLTMFTIYVNLHF